MFNLIIVLPVFQHGIALADTVLQLRAMRLPLLVVNDGSDARQSHLIREVCQDQHITLLERDHNGGKGQAVIDGLRMAQQHGYTHAFQIDADGQHDLSRLTEFIRIARKHPSAMVLGYPCYDKSVPLSRKIGRLITHVWVWINTWSLCVRDSMCGFRVYPIPAIVALIDATNIGRRMEFDIEICVRACWQGMTIINRPVRVVYPHNGTSNFRVIQDNMLLCVMHARLFFGMWLRLPSLLCGRLGYSVRRAK